MTRPSRLSFVTNINCGMDSNQFAECLLKAFYLFDKNILLEVPHARNVKFDGPELRSLII